MGRGIFVRGGDDVFGDGVEDARVLAKDANVEGFLRVTETKAFELRVKTSFFRPEVGDT